uniref:CNH domain-containing protein n=1 Tax=Macrostomum lignano TaxID=282301 RepID=A0A1I8JRD3_9PLAT
GHLLSYSISGLDKCPSIQLLKSHKSFSKRPIQQLEAVIPERSGRQSNLRLCVHVKQRLLLYHWPPGAWQFAELRQELALPLPRPEAVSWIGPNSALRRIKNRLLSTFEFALMTEKSSSCFLSHRPRARSWAPVERNTLALCSKDSKTMFVNEKGRWRRGQKSNDGPLMGQYLAPFLIGICADFVEVRTVDQRTSLIQNLDIPSLRSVQPAPRRVVRCLCQVSLLPAPAGRCQPDKVIIQRRDFELALRLHEIGQSDPDRADELRDIETVSLGEVPLRLQPVLPAPFRDRVSFPRPVPEFSARTCWRATCALAKYLSSVRKKAASSDRSEGARRRLLFSSTLLTNTGELLVAWGGSRGVGGDIVTQPARAALLRRSADSPEQQATSARIRYAPAQALSSRPGPLAVAGRRRSRLLAFLRRSDYNAQSCCPLS